MMYVSRFYIVVKGTEYEKDIDLLFEDLDIEKDNIKIKRKDDKITFSFNDFLCLMTKVIHKTLADLGLQYEIHVCSDTLDDYFMLSNLSKHEENDELEDIEDEDMFAIFDDLDSLICDEDDEENIQFSEVVDAVIEHKMFEKKDLIPILFARSENIEEYKELINKVEGGEESKDDQLVIDYCAIAPLLR